MVMLLHQMLNSASSSVEILISAPCKTHVPKVMTFVEVNDLCRSSPVPKFVYPTEPFIRRKFMIFRASEARQNFEETSNRTFSFEDFSYKVVRLFFDQLHHVTTNEISLLDALELMVLCNHQGQIDQKSNFETRLYEELRHQILTEVNDSKELCHIWMFLRSWGPSGWD